MKSSDLGKMLMPDLPVDAIGDSGVTSWAVLKRSFGLPGFLAWVLTRLKVFLVFGGRCSHEPRACAMPC